MIYFFTFCVYISKYSKLELKKSLSLLLKSIHKYHTNYKIICYINFEIKKDLYKKYNIIFRKYYDNNKKIYKNKWLNLSFNKIKIYKDLYFEFKKDYIWIDLDTILTSDISYINNLDNCFIENGGMCQNKNVLFSNNKKIVVPRNRYIQGNFWKLNITLYKKLIKTFNELEKKKLVLRYDLQDLFSYYILILKKDKDTINILGNTIKQNTINGLAVWDKKGNKHASINGFNNLYYDNNNILRSKFYKDKEIHILSFTFVTLKKLWNNNNFNKMFNY